MTEHHKHGHDAPPQPDHPPPSTRHHYLGLALNELLIEKGIYSAGELHAAVTAMEEISPETHGARIVATAWTDSSFKQALLNHPNDAIAKLGIDPGPAELRVLECTESLHHVVVCTLCSCYPRALLGPPPAWYKSLAYRARTVREPREVLMEFGTRISPDTEIRVHDSTAELRFMVLPLCPDSARDLEPDDLAKLVTRNSMIGVTRLQPLADGS